MTCQTLRFFGSSSERSKVGQAKAQGYHDEERDVEVTLSKSPDARF